MNGSPAIPVVTGAQMAAVDRAMADVCGLDLLQVMEIAGRAVAIAVRHLQPCGSVAVLCGSGGNGGDGFVCARYLAGWGYSVRCWLSKPDTDLRGLAAHNMRICQKLGISISSSEIPIDLSTADLIVDGLFGFGLSAAPSGRAAELIEAANRASSSVFAIDIPSGIDATTGASLGHAIVARTTVTLGLPKSGLLRGRGPAHAGEVIVADIGIPQKAFVSVGIPLTDRFLRSEFLHLDGTPVSF